MVGAVGPLLAGAAVGEVGVPPPHPINEAHSANMTPVRRTSTRKAQRRASDVPRIDFREHSLGLLLSRRGGTDSFSVEQTCRSYREASGSVLQHGAIQVGQLSRTAYFLSVCTQCGCQNPRGQGVLVDPECDVPPRNPFRLSAFIRSTIARVSDTWPPQGPEKREPLLDHIRECGSWTASNGIAWPARIERPSGSSCDCISAMGLECNAEGHAPAI